MSAPGGAAAAATFRDDTREWIEPDGLGGFASGTVGGIRTRRYHALLLAATSAPAGRVLLVNGFEAWVDSETASYALTSQRYAPGVVHPEGSARIVRFRSEPWPCWRYHLPEGIAVEQELLAAHGSPVVLVRFRIVRGRRSARRLRLRPFLSARDPHYLHRENGAFRFEPELHEAMGSAGVRLRWRPYRGGPAVDCLASGTYRHDPLWYRQFLYTEERARGLDDTEDLGSPGELVCSLGDGEACWIVALEGWLPPEAPAACARRILESEARRRRRLGGPLARAADAYLVRRGAGWTIIAGYPWFTDWARDTFIALRGLGLAMGRLNEVRAILLEWAEALSGGLFPNRFPERGAPAEFHAVDAPLWFVVAVAELSAALERASPARWGRSAEQKLLAGACATIVSAYAQGTHFSIRADGDGLLAAGEPGVQLTWMDAKVGDRVVTPRIGKPVELQALWLHALDVVRRRLPEYGELFSRARDSFLRRFWNEEGGFLYDVVDVDHRSGTVDARCRPNQIFAVGGLPLAVLDGVRARRVVDVVEQCLWTPLGLRTLAPSEPGYRGRYEGGPVERDEAYHQGTAWPWLLGPFVEAWVRVRGRTPEVVQEARERFLAPLWRHLQEAGLGHVSEIADGDPPHAPRGCPFQAWSLGELLRCERAVLATGSESGPVAIPEDGEGPRT